MYLRGLLCDSISDPNLQYTILATITVNPSGVKNKGIAADEQQELINLDLSLNIRNHANSTYTLDITLDTVVLNRKPARVIRTAFESDGPNATNFYTDTKSIPDVHAYAEKLHRMALYRLY